MEDIMRKCIFLCSLLFLLATVIIVANENISAFNENQISNFTINTGNVNSLITEVPEVASNQIVDALLNGQVDGITNYAITFSNNTGYTWVTTTSINVATSNITDQNAIINEENLNNSLKTNVKLNNETNRRIDFDTINEFETINLVYSNLNRLNATRTISGNDLFLI